MTIKQFEIWTADLNPQIGTEPEKIRPVFIIQTDLLNSTHPSTVICPVTTNVIKGSEILRVHIKKGIANVLMPSDLMIDQIRAIDNKRLIKKIGDLPNDLRKKVVENIKIVLDLD
ncbi:MAG: type II toxin-antitoxin system PemK/MazF family toxin [Bacteroidales bacterium]|nr:type II toxin-antitoxin system PemK/MazF family toxin [Bacteroidales bacterium]MCB8998633.1 type II toxin-antitoxin system PemK/MazF family toxin [Bacteroidales bacterium]MCB9012499.1 type II toxin-antitoxin system PemK/MazF family toxin [Bacteroidales bacterium]